MSRRLASAWLLACLLPGGACDRPPAPPSHPVAVGNSPESPADQPLLDQPLLDHPEFVHWKQFPVGTGAVRRKEVTNQHGVVRVTTRVHLAESNAQRVVVETQITVEHQGQAPLENPPLRAEFPARFRLPPGMQPEQFSLPSLKARRVGAERREALGREFPAQVFQWDEVNEAGPMQVKLWWSDEVPGRILRQEINGHEHQSVEEVAEISFPQI